jgi:hypothetical protein
MTYIEILVRINRLNNATDIEQIVNAMEKLTDKEEYETAKDALFRAVLAKARDEHPQTKSFSIDALKLRG